MRKDLKENLLKKVSDEYDYLADQFSLTRQYQWGDTEYLASYVKEGDNIVDWGCGNGRLYDLFVNSNVSYLGIDNCRGLIEKAQEKYPNINWQVGSDLPYNSYDKIFAIASWHHLPGEELRLQKLKEFNERLKENGYLLLTTWNLRQKKYFWLWFRNNLRNMFSGYDWNDVLVPWKTRERVIYRYYHSISKRRFIKVIKKAGFKIEECYYSDNGKKGNWLTGKDIVMVARKV